ncbi:NADP-dependent oxidoreductase domain-containing protein [Mariannaea sp. PMI_226]|nr:NADP-dependent oxidoreductase domain-containing protein [Mariannaea sp. PMI_226]
MPPRVSFSRPWIACSDGLKVCRVSAMDRANFHPIQPSLTPGGSAIPPLLYGTAEKTDPLLIFSALKTGYRGLDCACQPHFYYEDVVGQAIALALSPVSSGGLGLRRSDMFIQTKFTTPAGHTHRPDLAPYAHEDPPAAKVRKSLKMSLAKLGVDYVDALLLHGPMPTLVQTLDIWLAMESCIGDRVRNIGVSNFSLEQLMHIYRHATIKPAIVQNRFWPQNHFDSDVRAFCADNRMVYQAFWILTGNPQLLDTNIVGWLADKTGTSREDALYTLVLSLGKDGSGISVLNGTKNLQRMQGSLEAIHKVGVVPDMVKRGFLEQLNLEKSS